MAQILCTENGDYVDTLLLVAIFIVKLSSILHEVTPLIEVVLKHRRHHKK